VNFFVFVVLVGNYTLTASEAAASVRAPKLLLCLRPLRDQEMCKQLMRVCIEGIARCTPEEL